MSMFVKKRRNSELCCNARHCSLQLFLSRKITFHFENTRHHSVSPIRWGKQKSQNGQVLTPPNKRHESVARKKKEFPRKIAGETTVIAIEEAEKKKVKHAWPHIRSVISSYKFQKYRYNSHCVFSVCRNKRTSLRARIWLPTNTVVSLT